MFIADLFENYITEAGPKLVVFYPGRFQPFHLGHKEVFQSLQNKFGRDSVFISTSNKTELPKSPFNFNDKVAFMTAAGIPADRILEVSSPYKLPEQFDQSNTIFIVAVGAPDAERLKPDSYKKDGNESYFKTFKNLQEVTTADKHGYVIIADERHKEITVNGQPVDVSHGTQARAAWNAVRNNPKQRGEFLVQMYGRNDPELGRILDKIPAPVSENKITDPELAHTVDYAVGHYPTIRDPGQAFMKFVARSLKHGLETDIEQQKKIGELSKQIEQLKMKISELKLDEDLPPPENARKTQIAGTLGTYKKAGEIFKQHGVQGRALDFGAGLGKGTAELGSDAESYEPYPGPDFKPHYIDVTKIPSNSYERIVNLNVLNVVPNVGEHRIRDEIVRNIGRVLAPGGMAIITTRGRDVLTIKGTPGEEPMSMVSSIGTYQKGFTQKELKEYVQSVLGDNFIVNSVKLGPAGVVIKKKQSVDEEAAGVGVVKNSKDPRYVMATMGDQNDVNGGTLNKMMKGYHLAEEPNEGKIAQTVGTVAGGTLLGLPGMYVGAKLGKLVDKGIDKGVKYGKEKYAQFKDRQALKNNQNKG